MANDLFLLAAPIPKLKYYMVLMVPPNISVYNPEFHCNFLESLFVCRRRSLH